MGADAAGSLEAKQLAACALRFHNAVGKKRKRVAGLEHEAKLGITGRGENSQGEAPFQLKLGAIPIWRQVAGVCDSNLPVRADFRADAGDEALVAGELDLAIGTLQQRAGTEILRS